MSHTESTGVKEQALMIGDREENLQKQATGFEKANMKARLLKSFQ